MTSSLTSFHSKSLPVSWAIVTVILLWMPCGKCVNRKSLISISNYTIVQTFQVCKIFFLWTETNTRIQQGCTVFRMYFYFK